MENVTIIILGIGILFYLITCWAIMDIAKKDFGAITTKAIWGFTALIPFIGCVIYLIFGYKKGKKPNHI